MACWLVHDVVVTIVMIGLDRGMGKWVGGYDGAYSIRRREKEGGMGVVVRRQDQSSSAADVLYTEMGKVAPIILPSLYVKSIYPHNKASDYRGTKRDIWQRMGQPKSFLRPL